MLYRSFGVHLFCLSPNTTHILQPLNVGVFGPVKSAWRKILKDYKVKTRAENITKNTFPGLLKELWDISVMPEHLRGGFKALGLAPFNSSAVNVTRLSPALVTDSQDSPAEFHGSGILTLAPAQTPIRVELRAFFVDVLRPAAGNKKVRRRRRVELSDFGEVLTSDEVLERLEQTEAEKRKKKAEKKACKKGKGKTAGSSSSSHGSGSSSDAEVKCGKCEQIYTDAESADWIGCDICDSWWHYWCAGLDSMLTEEEEWICDHHDCLNITYTIYSFKY